MSRKRHTSRFTPEDEPHFLVRTLAAEFADNQTLAPHTHPWGQLIYSVAGFVSVWTGHGSWVVPPHWAVWAPAGVAHSMRFTGATSLCTLYLRPDFTGLALQSGVIAVSPLLRELLLRAVEIGFLDARDPAQAAIANLIVHELCTASTPAFDLPLPRSALLRRIAEHIMRAPDNRSGHASLAKRFAVGARTLERGFATETGLALGQWRRQARFLQALRRLAAGATVKQAALDAGYRSPSAFIAAFKGAFNTTPGRYIQSNPG